MALIDIRLASKRHLFTPFRTALLSSTAGLRSSTPFTNIVPINRVKKFNSPLQIVGSAPQVCEAAPEALPAQELQAPTPKIEAECNPGSGGDRRSEDIKHDNVMFETPAKGNSRVYTSTHTAPVKDDISTNTNAGANKPLRKNPLRAAREAAKRNLVDRNLVNRDLISSAPTKPRQRELIQAAGVVVPRNQRRFRTLDGTIVDLNAPVNQKDDNPKRDLRARPESQSSKYMRYNEREETRREERKRVSLSPGVGVIFDKEIWEVESEDLIPAYGKCRGDGHSHSGLFCEAPAIVGKAYCPSCHSRYTTKSASHTIKLDEENRKSRLAINAAQEAPREADQKEVALIPIAAE